MITEHYTRQRQHWPADGRHILAQYDDTSLVVYQAYRPAIADFAVKHQRFGGEFSYTRMSWIKPNFLWMMFRAGRFASHEDWKAAIEHSDVRLQWDPDHDPIGKPLERRAIQLGLRGRALRRYGEEALLGIEDITPFVIAQRAHLRDGFAELVVPCERVYPMPVAAAS